MIDLSSTLFFKGKIEISSKSECDLLWILILKIREWMIYKWKRLNEIIPTEYSTWTLWKCGSYFSSKNNIVHFKSTYYDEEEKSYWACKIIESRIPQDGLAPREWVTEIGFFPMNKTAASVSIVIYYSDRPGFIGPCECAPQGSIPRLIRLLSEDSKIICTAGGKTNFLRATYLKPGDFPAFWKFVCDEKRDIPIVYLSPKKTDESSDDARSLLDPHKLVKLLGPNALVYYANDIDFSREMTQLCSPDTMACYSGAIRVYAAHPNVKSSGDSYRHRLITAKKIMGNEETIYEILRRALSQDVHFYEKMFRMEDCQKLIDKAHTQKMIFNYRESLERDFVDTAIEKEQSLHKEYEKIEEERIEWEIQRDEFENQISELKEELYQEKAASDSYREEAILSSQRKNSLDEVRNIERYPVTPTEIASYFEQVFKDRIVFTERGRASLADCQTDPRILWDALYQMATLLYDLHESDEINQVDKEFDCQSNFQIARSAGMMTRKNPELMRQYKDIYQGREINIERHVKSSQSKENSPQFLRIYYCYDQPTRKIVIGSCGKHLDNYSTKKIK